jgi:Ca2+-transporting ATPase
MQARQAGESEPLEAHAVAIESVLRALGSGREGLEPGEIERRRARHGPNELRRPPETPAWRRFLRQFAELVVLVLLAAAGLSLALGEVLDAAVILAILLLNATLGFLQEERATRAIEALAELARPRARVLRAGGELALPASEVVPGDVLLIGAGDAVPADARLIASTSLRTQESALTGESTPVEKEAGAVMERATPLAERRNSIFLGTLVAGGHGRAVVVATGMATELGRIASLLQSQRLHATPLQERLAVVGRWLALLCLAIVAALGSLLFLRGEPLGEVLVLSIGLAVAAVPEGLTAVITVALALGTRRLVERNALVRKLPSVETLGSVTVICTDKTGTLTRDEMTVREVRTPSGVFHVAGSGYAPQGEITRADGAPAGNDPELHAVLLVGARCNNARLAPPVRPGAPWTALGDPTEGALVVAALKAGIEPELGPDERVLFELPFDSERKLMSVAVTRGGTSTVYAKGAAEVVLARCTSVFRGGRVEPLDAATRAEILAQCRAMAGRALRVLALAFRSDHVEAATAEQELCLAGLVGMQDPPREEVPAAVRTCLGAGIRPVMITGDHPDTALAIAREIGLAGPAERAVTGTEVEGWSEGELARELASCAVFARTSAEHKLRIVRAWRERGAVVAMTGDGVNDAPALQEADIGIAMGRTGTDVTRLAADMVLLDDNFASIVSAVREGRGIFDDIRKAVHFLLTANLAEVLTMVVATLAGWPIPLTAIQLLWMNLVTDGLPALALGIEPPEEDLMRRRPLARRAPVISLADGAAILVRGAFLAATVAAVYRWALAGAPERASTMAFAVLVLGQLALALAFRSQSRTLFGLGPFGNPRLLLALAATAVLQVLVHELAPLRALFGIERLAASDWPLVVGASLVPVTLIELGKLLRAALSRRRRPSPA